MSGPTAERFVVWSLRAMAFGFFVVGVLFLADPDGVLERMTDLGGDSFTPAPETGAKLWLTLGFSYMIVITALATLAQTDIQRYRHLILILALAKTASSVTALGFYIFDADVFIYLANFVIDGSLVGAAVLLWALTGRAAPVGSPP